MSPTNLLNRSVKGGATLLGAVGLGAIALSMTAPAAHAGKLRAGVDFWKTPPSNYELRQDIEVDAGFINMNGVLSEAFTIFAGSYELVGHPTGILNFEPPPQQNVVCFDRHGFATNPGSTHAVQCLPDPDEPNPNDPEDPLEWVDTIVERLEDSAQLREVGDMAIIPVQMKSLSLVGTQPIPVPFDDDTTKDYLLKVTLADDVEQLVGQLKLTVTEVREMDGMTFIDGRLLDGGGPSIGTEDQDCLQGANPQEQIANFNAAIAARDPNCLGLPGTWDFALKNAETEEISDLLRDENDYPITITDILVDGTRSGHEDELFFTFKKTPEPSSAVPIALVGLAGIWTLRKKQFNK